MRILTKAERRAAFTDPVKFQRHHLKRRLWQRQKDIVQSVETHSHTAVKGCHASGKTFVASGLPLAFLSRYPDGKVFQVSPTLRQVKAFWGEVELARKGCTIGFPQCSTTGLKIHEGRYALGASSSRGVNIQGFHGSKVLIIVDEAPGVEASLWEAIAGIAAGGDVSQLDLGNPTVPSGQFFDNFKSSSRCNGITISAFDTPNLWNAEAERPYTIQELLEMDNATIDQHLYPFLVRRRWVRDRYLEWGPDDHRYVARVLGQFPSQSEWSVFSLEWVEQARRDPRAEELAAAVGHFIQVGVDVAAGGDAETVAYARVDGIVLDWKAWPDQDPGGKLILWLQRLQSKYQHLYPKVVVLVDIVGPGVHLAPRLAMAGFEVHGFQAGSAAMEPSIYDSAKSEAYWAAREFFRDGSIAGLEDAETRDQLTTIQYRETLRGKIQIEPKKDAREKRGVKSPDRAEALIMSLYPIVPHMQSIDYSGQVVTHPY